MRGEPGTEVTITVLRGEETMDLTVQRAQIEMNYVEYEMLEDAIGYVIVYDFMGDAADGFKEAVSYFQQQGAKGMILDLRSNGGGLVTDAVAIADVLLPEGVIVSTEDPATATGRKSARTRRLWDCRLRYWSTVTVRALRRSSRARSRIPGVGTLWARRRLERASCRRFSPLILTAQACSLPSRATLPPRARAFTAPARAGCAVRGRGCEAALRHQ